MTLFQIIQLACFIFVVIEFAIAQLYVCIRVYYVYIKPAKEARAYEGYSWVDQTSKRLLDKEEELNRKKQKLK